MKKAPDNPTLTPCVTRRTSELSKAFLLDKYRNIMEKYKGWEIVDSIPDGWVIDKLSDSPLPNSVFITNNKSPLKGQKRAILKIKHYEGS